MDWILQMGMKADSWVKAKASKPMPKWTDICEIHTYYLSVLFKILP